MTPSQTTYETFPQIAAGIAGAQEGLTAGLAFVDDLNPVVKAQSPAGKLAEDLRDGVITVEEYNNASRKSGMRVSVGPDGQMTFEQGVGVTGDTPPKMTVDAAKNTGFYIRTKDANAVLDDLDIQGTRFWQQALEGAPMGLGNFARDAEFQKFDQARRDFVNAILRRESGAVISDQEFDNANQQYFPVPGDSSDVIEQKRKNRVNAIEGLKLGSGGGAEFADRQEAAAPDSEPSAAKPDITFQNDEQRSVFEKYSQ